MMKEAPEGVNKRPRAKIRPLMHVTMHAAGSADTLSVQKRGEHLIYLQAAGMTAASLVCGQAMRGSVSSCSHHAPRYGQRRNLISTGEPRTRNTTDFCDVHVSDETGIAVRMLFDLALI